MSTVMMSSPSSDPSNDDVREISPTPPTPERQQSGFIAEIFKFALIALLVVVPFRMFVAQPFIVSGASMEPTFKTGQYLIVDQVSYRFGGPVRGDVVIFRFPEDPSKFFIKRIVGLPGDTVSISGETVTIAPISGDSFELPEPYVSDGNQKEDYLTVTLSEGEYFVMGDNRSASSDSRVWGPVPKENIVGKAFVRLLPLTTIGLFPGEYHASGSNMDSE